MNKMCKRILSLILCLCMLAGMTATANADEIPFSATAVVSEDKQSIAVTISAATAILTDGFQFAYVLPEGWTASVALSDAVKNWTVQNSVNYVAYGNEVTTTDLVTITYSVPAGTTGTFSVGATNLKVSGDGGDVVFVNGGTATTTVTIASSDEEKPVEPGVYKATVAGAATNGNPVRVEDTLKINVGTNQAYAAAEMIVTYDATKVAFNQNASTLGSATVTVSNNTLKLADYGENKAGAADNYVLAFDAVAEGDAVFTITKAGFGTGDSAATANLVNVVEANLGSTTITIAKKLVNVTFSDNLFYAASTTLNAGENFIFYPEQITGGYYEYTLPTATVNNQPVTVTPTTDGGWVIANVNGDVTIAPAVRNPKNFGAVTYTGPDISNVTTNAVYLTPVTFTIPADKAAGVEDGYRYDVSVTVAGSAYSMADPTVDENGNRIYTIPGAEIKGAVTVTVTKAILDANKVIVSIGGNADADGNLGAGPSVAVQVDKNTGEATLKVDTTTGLNKGYNYEVSIDVGTIVKNEDGTYTISGLDSNAEITINRTLNVEGVKNGVEYVGADGSVTENKEFLALNDDNMWLIQLPNNVQNTTDAVYKYHGEEMFWSPKHNNYVIVVTSETAPAITANMFSLESVTATPILDMDWDVNKTGTVDANDAQLIWNMYSKLYTGITDDVTAEKFILADANYDGILDTKDAVVIINKILGIAAN